MHTFLAWFFLCWPRYSSINHLLLSTQMRRSASGSNDVSEQISLGGYRERLNTHRGECHCFGDLQEGFYVFSCSLAAAECQCWIPVTQCFLLFCTIRSTPHRQRYKPVPLGLLWPIFSVCVFCYYYCTPQSVLTDLIPKEYFSFIRTTKKIM